MSESSNFNVVIELLIELNRLLYIAWISTYGFPYPGQFKAVAKAELSHIPAFGWLLYLSDFIFLKRKWETDRIYITSRLRDLSNFSESGFPLSILIFPEGTRLTPQKLENSQNFARSNGLFVFNKLLYPRFKGFLGLMPIIRSKLDYLVDCTLIFKQGIPTIADVLKGKADQTVHLHIRKFPVSEIPEEPDSLKEWLRQKWIEKEKIIESYEKNPKLLQSGAMPCNGPPSYIGCYILHLLTATLCGNLIYKSTNVKYGLQVLILSITLFFGVCIAIGRRSLSNSKIGIAPSNNEISKQSNYSKK